MNCCTGVVRLKNWIPFARHGVPELDVVVGISEVELRILKKLGVSIPETTETAPTSALLDTGAHRSFVPQEFVDRLRLLPCGQSEIHTPITGAVIVDLYALSLRVMVRGPGAAGWQGEGLVGTVQVGVIPTNTSGRGRAFPKPIIGRDVLSTCRFEYDGPGQRLEFRHHQMQARRGFLSRLFSVQR